ncbi:MFS transporter, partial [Brucella pseudogrignonensis]|uniref:MFS transporter n=1 Tax=Brucella pseudogrignonensis TaxID=419475 RepID=UPI00124DA737
MLPAKSAWLSQMLQGAKTPNPILIVAVVFLGAFFTTLQGRLFSISLGDIRGAFGLDVTEGTFLSAALNTAQLLIMPVTIWLALIFGPARVVILPSLTIAIAALIIPFMRSFEVLLLLHFIAGLCLGTYLPLTISLALRNLTPRFWLLAMAAYSLRASFGTDVGVGLSGAFVDAIDWRLIYWSATFLGPLMAFLAWKALPLTPIDYQKLRRSDWGGMAMFCLGLALLFAGFTLGETMGWFKSGLVSACLAGGTCLLICAVVSINFQKNAFVSFAPLANHNVRTALLIACLYGILMAPTSILIPNFLAVTGKLKPLQTGSVSMLVFITYFALTPLVVWLARRIDARLLLVVGLGIIILTAATCGSSLSNEWRTNQFVPALILFATGECLTLMGIIPVIVVNMNPVHAAAIGVFAPIARIFAPGVASGIISLILRLSSDTHAVALRAQFEVGQPLIADRISDGVARVSSLVS